MVESIGADAGESPVELGVSEELSTAQGCPEKAVHGDSAAAALPDCRNWNVVKYNEIH